MNTPKFANLVDLLSYRAHWHPERMAFRFFADGENESAQISYGQLVQDAKALAVELQARNLQDRHVLLLYPPGLDFITAFIGCLFARVVPVPAYPPEAHRIKHTLQRLQTIIQDARSPAVLTDSQILTQARQLLLQMPDLALNQLLWLQSDHLIQAGNPLDWRMPNFIDDDLAFLQYTSGSTSQPKGVMISHHNLMVNCEMFQRATDHQEGLAKLVCWVPFYHDMGLVGHLMNSLYVGGETLIMPPIAFLKKPFRWLKLISDHQATSTGAPNFAYDLCVRKISAEERAQLDLSSLQFALNAAEPVHASTIQRFIEAFEPCGFDPHSFAPSYGMAETTVFISTGRRETRPRFLSVDKEELAQNRVLPIPQDDPRAITLVGCGQTWLNDKLGIVDPETFLVLPEGQIGEIWIQGEHIALGYWNQAELSRETFQAVLEDYEGEFLRTGDLGFVHQGDVFITGRIKDLIIVRGRNLYPQDLERSVDELRSQLPLIRPGCGAAFEYAEGVVLFQEISLKITADTVPQGSEKWLEIQAEADKMCRRIAIELGHEYDVAIQAVVLLEPGILPKTSSGKIMRQACKQAYAHLVAADGKNALKVLFHWQSGMRSESTVDLRVKPEDDKERGPEDDKERGPEDDNSKESVDNTQRELNFAVGLNDVVQRGHDVGRENGIQSGHDVAVGLEDGMQRGNDIDIGLEVGVQHGLEVDAGREDATPRSHDLGSGQEDETKAELDADTYSERAVQSDHAAQSLHDNQAKRNSEAPFNPVAEGHEPLSGRDSVLDESISDSRSELPKEDRDTNNQILVPVSKSNSQQDDNKQQLRHASFDERFWRQWLSNWLADHREASPDEIDLTQNFQTMGMDSLLSVRLVADLEEALQHPLPETLLWDCPNPISLLSYLETLLLAAHHPATVEAVKENLSTRSTQDWTQQDDPAKPIEQRLSESALVQPENTLSDPDKIAIIGMACRLPGGIHNPDDFWAFLAEARDGIQEIPADRWSVDDYFEAATAAKPFCPGKMYLKQGGFLEQVDQFDPAFFQISAREAIEMDPQQRLLLELSWEALEHAGIPHQQMYQSQTGIFIGLSNVDYAAPHVSDFDSLNAYTGTGNALSVAAGRIAYWLGSQGPTMTLDTACSSSLIAIHQACQSLRLKESQVALAGGANLILSPALNIYFSQLQALAPDGHCKSFDAAADGFVRSEGAGLLVLKRLADAQHDGDRILAVIRASAINHDGPSHGLTAPNALAQEKVIQQALKQAQVNPEDVDFIECHGTGTALGDPIEVQALQALYLTESRKNPLYLGAVKSNLGHLESAAGVTGLIKTVLALQAQYIPANLHFQTLNPRIKADPRIQIPTRLIPWPGRNPLLRLDATDKGQVPDMPLKPALAAVSSFGISGSNAHLVLEACAETTSAPTQDVHENHFICLSAQSENALLARIQELGPFLNKRSQFQSLERQAQMLTDLSFTTCRRRSHLKYRWAVTVKQLQELQGKLAETLLQEPLSLAKPYPTPRIAFVFSGQGAQWLGMAQTLLQSTEPRYRVFGSEMKRCADALKAEMSWDFFAMLSSSQESDFQKMDVVQVLIFAIQVSLARLWLSWGVEPAVLIGHSMGEVAAAHIAGILTLPDAVKVIVRRSRLLAQQADATDGGMLYTGLSPEGCRPFLSDKVQIGVYNSPESTVLSGERQALVQIEVRLQSQGVFARFVQVPVAAHSPQIERFEAELKAALSEIQPQPMQYPFLSSVELPAVDSANDDDSAKASAPRLDQNYWYHNLRQAVHFSQSVQEALKQDIQIWLEISPHPLLLPSIQACARHVKLQYPELPAVEVLTLASLKREQDERLSLEHSLIQLYQAGVSLNWHCLVADARIMTLPNYPWQGQRYWHAFATNSKQVTLKSVPVTARAPQSAQKGLVEVHQELFRVDWERSLIPMPNELESGHWLVFADPLAEQFGPLSQTLALLLKAQGQHLIWVYCGHDLQLEQQPFVIDPLQNSHYQGLIHHLNHHLKRPLHGVIYLSQSGPIFEPEQAETRYWAFKLLLQELEELQSHSLRLFLITQGAWSAEHNSLNQAGLSGLCRTAFYEYPQWHCSQIDLAAVPDPRDYPVLVMELLAQSPETQILIRKGERRLARLKAYRKDANLFNTALMPSEAVLPRWRRLWRKAPAVKIAAEFEVHSQATYLITGGLGELGLITARFLIQQGAKYLVLIGRSATPDAETQSVLHELQGLGAQIRLLSLDMSDALAVKQSFQELRLTSLPIRGVIHAAGVLQDGLIASQGLDAVKQVFAPKIAGAWNLHQATLADPLDFFVCYSSITSVLGMPGQSNYAAANCFLDALVQYRCAQGLPAQSINWGPWHRPKLLEQMDSERLMLSHYGFDWLSQEQGLTFLESILKRRMPQACVMGLDLRQLTQSLPQTQQLPLLNHLARSQAFELELRPPLFKSRASAPRQMALPGIDFSIDESGEVQAITRLASENLPDVHELEGFLLQQIARILGVNPAEINTQTSLRIYGFDSLMALELKAQVQARFGLTLKSTERFQSMSISEMAERILQNPAANSI